MNKGTSGKTTAAKKKGRGLVATYVLQRRRKEKLAAAARQRRQQQQEDEEVQKQKQNSHESDPPEKEEGNHKDEAAAKSVPTSGTASKPSTSTSPHIVECENLSPKKNQSATTTTSLPRVRDGKWECECCTLLNLMRLRRCVACETRRPVHLFPKDGSSSGPSTDTSSLSKKSRGTSSRGRRKMSAKRKQKITSPKPDKKRVKVDETTLTPLRANDKESPNKPDDAAKARDEQVDESKHADDDETNASTAFTIDTGNKMTPDRQVTAKTKPMTEGRPDASLRESRQKENQDKTPQGRSAMDNCNPKASLTGSKNEQRTPRSAQDSSACRLQKLLEDQRRKHLDSLNHARTRQQERVDQATQHLEREREEYARRVADAQECLKREQEEFKKIEDEIREATSTAPSPASVLQELSDEGPTKIPRQSGKQPEPQASTSQDDGAAEEPNDDCSPSSKPPVIMFARDEEPFISQLPLPSPQIGEGEMCGMDEDPDMSPRRSAGKSRPSLDTYATNGRLSESTTAVPKVLPYMGDDEDQKHIRSVEKSLQPGHGDSRENSLLADSKPGVLVTKTPAANENKTRRVTVDRNVQREQNASATNAVADERRVSAPVPFANDPNSIGRPTFWAPKRATGETVPEKEHQPLKNSTNRGLDANAWQTNRPARQFINELEQTPGNNMATLPTSSEPRPPTGKKPDQPVAAWQTSTHRQKSAKDEGKGTLWDDDSGIDGRSHQSSQPEYRYKETVRCKEKRQGLPCHDCLNCRKFYAALKATGHDVAYSQGQGAVQYSRHRARHSPSETPVDFWELDFIDERDARLKEERKQAELKKQN